MRAHDPCRNESRRELAGMLAAIAISPIAALAASEATGSAFVYVDVAASSFWRTATNNTVELSVDYPATATSASLSVAGSYGWSFATNDVAPGRFALELPAATSPETEDVYDLSLAFDDGTERTAKFAVIAGASDGPEGSARCVRSDSSSAWNRVLKRAVLPVPYGTTALSVGGVDVETGLDGAQGWYAFGPLAPGATRTVALEKVDEYFEVLLRSARLGFVASFK